MLSFAKAEFLALGYTPLDKEQEDGPNKWIQEQVLQLLEIFAAQGHSGSSAPFAISYFSRLAKGQPLSPLSGRDEEWTEVSEGLWQNKRCSSVFKTKNGVSYTVDGYVFWHWAQTDLDPDEPGYPGVTQYKATFTSGYSKKLVEFPFTPAEPEYVEVTSHEVDNDTGELSPGSGWWETIYPEWVNEQHANLTQMLKE